MRLFITAKAGSTDPGDNAASFRHGSKGLRQPTRQAERRRPACARCPLLFGLVPTIREMPALAKNARRQRHLSSLLPSEHYLHTPQFSKKHWTVSPSFVSTPSSFLFCSYSEPSSTCKQTFRKLSKLVTGPSSERKDEAGSPLHH